MLHARREMLVWADVLGMLAAWTGCVKQHGVHGSASGQQLYADQGTLHACK